MGEEYKDAEKVLKSRGYELLKLIGEGGTAKVYRVRETAGGNEYACKVSVHLKWLSLESGLLRSLCHPLFPKWRDYWEDAGRSYMVMEYIAGNSLEEHLSRRSSFTQGETVRIALELADGLGYLHERTFGIIYRDLKPSNVIIQPDGRARLLDLGAASVPEGWQAGTPGYASPEQQLSGSGAGDAAFEERSRSSISLLPASDVYSLGMMMHYMLSGRNPLVSGETIRPVGQYKPDILPGLDNIIWRCINVDPKERIPGMRELTRELSAYCDRNRFQIIIQEIKAFCGRRSKKKVVYSKNIWLSEYNNL